MSLLLFIKSSLKEINPWQNIVSLHTNIRGDILAGITVAIIALPLALAFGEISQLGPVAGIWGAIAGGIVGGLFGGCMVGVSGPTAPKAAQIGAFMGFFVIGTTNEPDLIAAFSIIFLSGLILLAISMLKVSRFIHYTPYSVIAGFMCGIGVIVILTQINAFVGLEAEKDIAGIFSNIKHTFQNINVEALYVAIPSLIILFLWGTIQKKAEILKHFPAPLLALVIGTSIAYFMNLEIPYIGDKMNSAKESKIFSLYFPDFTRLRDFIGPALALAGLAILDSLLSCKVADNMTKSNHNSNRETFGQGMANMTAGLIGGVTTATATMRTVANIKFGAKTPLASIVHGLTLLAILLGLGPFVAAIPTACLAAILFKVGIDILDYRIIPVLRKIPITDLIVFLVVLFVTIYEDLMIAVLIGILFSVIRSIKEIHYTIKSTNQHTIIPLSKSDFNPKGINIKSRLPVIVLQLQGPLFFGSAESLLHSYKNSTKHEMLIIDMRKITMIDLSGIYLLEDLINNVKDANIKVVLSNTNNHIKNILEKMNFFKHIGGKFYKDSKESVISTILESYKSEK
tara:strand:- start:1328 stop:3037 length:1710 start_codon:yes stop_codon:yes gene_type:complete